MRPSIVRAERRERAEDGGDIDALLEAVSTLNLRDMRIETAHGRTVIRGTVEYHLDRERLFDAVKTLDGWETRFVLEVDIRRHEVRGYHVVQIGESLESIAERYLGSPAKDMTIFEANRDRMNDPDQIFPGQQLVIPWR